MAALSLRYIFGLEVFFARRAQDTGHFLGEVVSEVIFRGRRSIW